MGTMAASFEACQGASLWSLKLSGIVQLLDDTQFLCVSWRLVLQRFLFDCAKVKLAGVKW